MIGVNIAAVMLLWFAIAGPTEVPPGTALPVILDHTIDAKKVKPGQRISASLAQAVPLGTRARIRNGSHLIGKVLEAGRNPDGTSYVRIRFDQIHSKKGGDIPVVTSLRAVASSWELEEAQLPKRGWGWGDSPSGWTTFQVGGDTVFRGGGHVLHGRTVVGDPVWDGVLARVLAVPQAGCHTTSGTRRVALWVFGSAACGAYGFWDHLDIAHGGDTDPVGDIVLESDKNVKIPTGTGMLLITIEPEGLKAEQ